jgi:hypothetical protein
LNPLETRISSNEPKKTNMISLHDLCASGLVRNELVDDIVVDGRGGGGGGGIIWGGDEYSNA